MNKLLYIARYRTLAVLLLLLLALAPAMAQNVVYQGETSTLAVQQEPGDTYLWELYDTVPVNFMTTPGNCPAASAIFVGGNTGASVKVQWLKPGIYFFKVIGLNITGCTNNIQIGKMEVKPSLPTAVLAQPVPDWICIGDVLQLKVNFTGAGPWDFTYTDGTTQKTFKNVSDSEFFFTVSPKVTTQYWITEVKNIFGTNSVPSAKITVVVNPKPESSKIYQHDP